MRSGTIARGKLSDRSCLLLLILMPFLLKLPGLLSILDFNSFDLTAYTTDLPSAIFTGRPTIDPNVGYTSQALGSLAAQKAFAGRSLWWNHYEGFGAPLAGEMQSAAFFPMTLLLKWEKGQLVEHILLQIISGIATYLFFRMRRIGSYAALTGATIFEFNGTFAWLANAVVNPICSRPVTLLGIECVLQRGSGKFLAGSLLIFSAVALSIVAGFPEVAYLDGLLIALWSLFRLAQDRWRLRSWVYIIIPALLGVIVTAPLLVAFADFLQVADIGDHTGPGYTGLALPFRFLPFVSGLPYLQGALFNRNIEFWSVVGGFVSLSSVFLIAACVKPVTQRGDGRLFLTWALIAFAVIFGLKPVQTAFFLLPLTSTAMSARYLMPSLEFSCAALVAFALDALAATAITRRSVASSRIAGLASTLIVGTVFGFGMPPRGALAFLVVGLSLSIVTTVAVAVWLLPVLSRWRLPILASSLIFEQALLFSIPLLGYPADAAKSRAGIVFLQHQLGNARFITTGPLQPNFGSQFGIAQLNYNDLPAPTLAAQYIASRLDPAPNSIIYIPTTAAVLARIARYEGVGVKYLVVNANEAALKLPIAFKDQILTIYGLRPKPYFTAPGCQLRVLDRDRLQSICQAKSYVTRLELFMPGWCVTVNGKIEDVRLAQPVFQRVAVEAGRSTLHFTFSPPHLTLAFLLMLGSGVSLFLYLVVGVRRLHESGGSVALEA